MECQQEQRDLGWATNAGLPAEIGFMHVQKFGCKVQYVYSTHTWNMSARIHHETLVVASKQIGLEVNADKTKYMVMSGDQHAGRSHSMKISNSSFERVEDSDIWEQP
jgi:hypothetical protein